MGSHAERGVEDRILGKMAFLNAKQRYTFSHYPGSSLIIQADDVTHNTQSYVLVIERIGSRPAHRFPTGDRHFQLPFRRTYYALGYDRHPLPLARGVRGEDDRLFEG